MDPKDIEKALFTLDRVRRLAGQAALVMHTRFLLSQLDLKEMEHTQALIKALLFIHDGGFYEPEPVTPLPAKDPMVEWKEVRERLGQYKPLIP